MAQNDQDITSANAKVILTVEELYPNGLALQQFSVDSAVTAEATQVTETRMGVDGYMSAGITPNIVPLTITLEANSVSKKALDELWSAMQNNRALYRCSMLIKLLSTGESYQFTRGVLQSATPLPALQKTLGATTWVFHFEKMEKL